MRAHKTAALLALTLALGTVPLGCADTTKTEIRKSETTRSADSSVGTGTGSEQRSVEQTKVVVEKDDDNCEGVLSCTTNFVGEFIALPFRLVGGLVRAIF